MEIKNVYIETYGCSANQNNSEIISGLLQQAGLNVVKNPGIADIAVLNTCIVKGPTEQRMLARIKELSKKFSERLIVAGCLPDVKSALIKSISPLSSQIGSHNIKEICYVVRKISERKQQILVSKENEVKLCMPKIGQNPVIGITQILEGCLGECSYCITRFAKGKLFSYPIEKIGGNVENDLQSGCKEIWITSQDNAAYGLDKGSYMLPELLNGVLNLKGKFMLRVGMMNPNHVLDILDELLECYANKKMFKFLHLPLQSGSNKVLKHMQRQYTAEDFLEIVREFRKKFPSLTLSTDIIVGYPAESAGDFNETMEIIEKVKPPILNISKFWRHQGTKAAELKELRAGIAIKRAIELMKLHEKTALQENEKLVGMEYECIVDKKGFDETFLARNRDYKLIAVKGRGLLGKFSKIKILKAKPHYLIGEAIQQ